MISIVKRIKSIPSFEGYYASEDGKIYSTLGKGCRDKYNIDKRVPPKELKYRKTKTGYCRVCMRRDYSTKREDVYVHRIIGDLCIPNPNNFPEINHKDCDTTNNSKNNLEWVDRKTNLDYAFTNGNMTRNNKGQFTHK